MDAEEIKRELDGIAAIRQLARLVADYYHYLVEQNVPSEVAAFLTGGYQDWVLKTIGEGSTEEDGE